MNFAIHPTFNLFFEVYLEEFIKFNKYETISLEEYNYHLVFKYAEIVRDLPFEENRLKEEKEYIEEKFGFFHIITLLREYDFKERYITLGNTKRLSKILRKEAFKIVSYLKNEILKDEVKNIEKQGGIISDLEPNNLFSYSKEIRDYARAFFGDLSKIELLQYLSENFTSTSQKFTQLTKYNQIYAYFHDEYFEIETYKSEKMPYIEKNAYKKLIRELFGFEYGDREIKGSTQKHLTQLKRLALEFQQNKI